MCCAEDSTIHSARLMPKATAADQWPARIGKVHPNATEIRAVAPSFLHSSAMPSLFQRAKVPTTMNSRTGTMIGTKTALK